jgi:hypothetical protein
MKKTSVVKKIQKTTRKAENWLPSQAGWNKRMRAERAARIREIRAEIARAIEAARTNPGEALCTGDGNNAWYYSLYLSTAQKRRRLVDDRLYHGPIG